LINTSINPISHAPPLLPYQDHEVAREKQSAINERSREDAERKAKDEAEKAAKVGVGVGAGA